MQQGESAQERGYTFSKWWGRKNQIESMLRPCHPVPWMELQGLMFVLMGFHLSVTRSLIACAISPFWNGMFIRCHWKYVTSFWFYIGSQGCLESLGRLCSVVFWTIEKLLRMWQILKVDRVQFALWDGHEPLVARYWMLLWLMLECPSWIHVLNAWSPAHSAVLKWMGI